MEKEVIITGFSDATSEGVTLHTNIPARLKSGSLENSIVWVSWDKIGLALFDNYTQKSEVSDRNKLRE